MSELRPYQAVAVQKVRDHWARRPRASVCLVAPTGAGKTRMGEECVVGAESAIWVAHRRELVIQAAARLRERFGAGAVSVTMPGEREVRGARIHVGTVQSFLARKKRPDAKVVVLDEAHHYVATEWSELREAYAKAHALGLTATPARGDGEALGDVFQHLVVAAQYSELVRDGYLVPARVHRPRERLGNDLAEDPLEAWMKLSEGSRTFVFCARVEIATRLAKRFRDAGVVAATIHQATPKRERDDTLARFRAGKITVLTNVDTLTEGVDVPEARCVVLMRAFGHVGGYLQAVGRSGRPAPGKKDSILIDLTGASLRHGLPTDDRAYSLAGRAISGGAFAGDPNAREREFVQEVKGVGLEMVARGALAREESIDEVKPVARDYAKEMKELEARKNTLHPAFFRMKSIELRGEK